jgi:hypothetical protein
VQTGHTSFAITNKTINDLAARVGNLIYEAGSEFARHGYDHTKMDGLAVTGRREIVEKLSKAGRG